ncbi:Integrase, catalytic core [Gossypium australe]|uniref:Integrase, catalytic core n=1 Tax=Gossypium australe TaxID=47621 RepID=A0A5B6WVT3_9ROSI|nr:Integrase, catalytic core [Gossypium australe]
MHFIPPTTTVMSQNNSPTTPIGSVRNKSLSSTEIEERRKKGICFWCGLKFTPVHKCVKSQLYQLFLDSTSDDESPQDDEVAKTPVLLLHALQGSHGLQTMRIAAHIGNIPVIMLVDTSSTHNFISSKLVRQLSWTVKQVGRLKVTIEDGRCLISRGTCQSVPYSLQWLHFSTNFLVLPIKGHHLVLRIQWLKTLGTITWEFNFLTMKFFHYNKLRQLQVGQLLGPYAMIMITPLQTVLLANVDPQLELQ